MPHAEDRGSVRCGRSLPLSQQTVLLRILLHCAYAATAQAGGGGQAASSDGCTSIQTQAQAAAGRRC
eukprot:scaffold6659_cov18-Tisochrysis_lutea.AAC.1